MGDRFAYLQEGIDLIFKEIGEIVAISSLYQTPAWGFSANDFYNACVKIKTFYTPQKVLNLLLSIENRLGRERNQTKGYASRTLDLDILLVDTLIINEVDLVVPHPKLHQRKFVSQPLSEIAARVKHPVIDDEISNLNRNCKDQSINRIAKTFENPSKSYFKDLYRYVAVEGVIGAGKTTLCEMIAGEFNAETLLENFKDNPFLPKFYENMDRFAFSLEMSFLAERYHGLQQTLDQYNLFKNFLISDYEISKSLIFSKVTLEEDEFKLYQKIFEIMYSKTKKPDLYIFLYQEVKNLLVNIAKRGRNYEKNITAKYLMDLQRAYLVYLKSQQNLNVVIIDITAKDFVANRKDFIEIVEIVRKSLLVQ